MGKISGPKRMKTSEKQDVNSERSLSELPDVILQHILSLLPTKDAVRTSVLSKRWEYLWTSVSSFVFNGYKVNRTHFMEFVDRALALHEGSIQCCSIMSDVLGDADRFRRWITVAVRRNVIVFSIRLTNCRKVFEFPHCFFTCASVQKLYLSISSPLKRPHSICFSSLKSLHLADITFSDDQSAQKLLSGCPVLEEMCLMKCSWVKVKRVIIHCPRLYSLTITEKEIDDDLYNLSDSCKVMIFGTCLKRFKYSGAFSNEYCLYDSSSLDKVQIQMDHRGQGSKIAAYCLFELLRGVFNVKELVLSNKAIQVLNDAAEILAFMPLFNNLSILTLKSEERVGYIGYMMKQVNLGCKALLKILQNSPCLGALRFCQGVELSADGENHELILDPVPPCFLSHLKRIEIYQHYATKKLHRQMMEILLSRAVFLDKLMVCYSECTWKAEELEKVHKELLGLPRASEVVEIKFTPDLTENQYEDTFSCSFCSSSRKG
ncbi:F-box/LRR-repeat protein [Tripterygium wilfordii]|uniref:F-box/LRR-repeat protein n=1 Tax=Tripterygium wilfordii TaxID=458696 RepID=A0A7J7C5C5_TRIWF|nr:F-box/FBD/LRR-repeat protein At5g56420-like [Tripterygium wilfordii]KAF5729027.1 F-box/LRR-repeat protein [Tripterygium wilfordii]